METIGYLALGVPALFGGIAWLYQKSWERQERRAKQYEQIAATLEVFISSRVDEVRMNEILAAQRRLWISGPDEVVRALNHLMDGLGSNRSNEENDAATAAFVLAMRKDASFMASILPRFKRSTLTEGDIILRVALLKRPLRAA